MSNEEFDNLKEELLWEGSKVAVLRCVFVWANGFWFMCPSPVHLNMPGIAYMPAVDAVVPFAVYPS